MTYLTRPVFDTPINWAKTPAKSFEYDLRSTSIAQAAPRFSPTQQQVIRGWEVELLLETEARIRAQDDFTDALLGRLNGFWFPSPTSHGRVVTKIDNNTFDIAHAGLSLLWELDPSLYLVFQPTGGSWYFGKISSVVDRQDGTERVTLVTDAGRTLNAGDVFRRLLYVRLASDVEEAVFIADHVQRRTLRVVELPEEYAAVETGQRPVYLYELSTTNNSGTTIYTRWTGLDVNVSSNLGGGTSYTFTSFPVRHRDVRQSLRSGPDDLTLETVHDAANPIAAYVPGSPPRPLFLRVWSAQYGSLNTVTAVFAGEVGETSAEGSRLTSKCSLIWARRGRKFPRHKIQPICNYDCFTAPCGLNKESWKATGTVTAVHYDRLTLTVSDPPISGKADSANAQFYALGWAQWNSPSHDLRGIVSNSARTSGGKLEIVLDMPITVDLVGQTVSIYAGCDGLVATCNSKFNNLVRHGGYPHVPDTNPSVKALEPETPNGNKK